MLVSFWHGQPVGGLSLQHTDSIITCCILLNITLEIKAILRGVYLQAFGEEKGKENPFKQNFFSRPWELNQLLCLLGNWNQKEPVRWLLQVPLLVFCFFFNAVEY